MKKLVLAVPLAAVLAVSMIVTPAFASGHLTFASDATVNTKDNNANTRIKVSFTTGADVPVDGSAGAFGYAVITDATTFNNVLVLVTHLGIDDSEHEDETSGFHTHVLDLKGATAACLGVEAEVDLANSVANAGFDLDAKYSIDGSDVSIGYTPTKLLADDSVDAVASFTVTPVFDGDGNLTNLCVDVVNFASLA
jgi:hypothetical protein